MPAVHRNGDSRACGAATIVAGQSTVFVEGKLFSVQGDPNSDGGGSLIASGSTVRVNNIPIIVVGDGASPDALCIPIGGAHCAPSATSGSGTVSAY
jgi:uncharacterized Zn-binding protein involved in type VI secretion